jgi:hypothetical protein
LAAKAAANVVLGPGVKAIAVAKTSSAASSGQGIGKVMVGGSVGAASNTAAVHFTAQSEDLYS